MKTENLDDVMIIVTAEGNSSWLREKLHPSSWARYFGEGIIPEYGEKMRVLRQVDNRIAYWLNDLDSYVKKMEQALNSNNLLSLVGFLAEINHKLKNAINDGKEVEELGQEALNKFDEESGYLPFLSDELEERLASSQDQLAKVSWDWLDRKKREWVANKFENKERKKRDFALRKLVDLTRQLVAEVQIQLRILGRARASGEIGVYIAGLKKISDLQKRFHKQFMPIYHEYLAPIVNRINERNKLESGTPAAEPIKKSPKVNLPTDTKPQNFVVKDDPGMQSMPEPGVVSSETIPISTTDQDVEVEVPSESGEIEITPDSGDRQTLQSEQLMPSTVPATPVKPEELPEIPDLEVPKMSLEEDKMYPVQKKTPKPRKKKESPKVASEVDKIWLKQVNAKFYQELNTAAQENNPYLLGWMLTKHAELIADVDENQSLKLLQIAESIANG